MDTTSLELETDAAALELKTTSTSAFDQVVCQEISKQERYSAD
jgi:hypothetical protein